MLTVAGLTLRDLVRRRVFVTLGLFAVLMILVSLPLRQLTVGQWSRLITDIGFGATDLCASLIAILLGATLISGDLERRTLYPLLAKPISRVSFVAGKYLGLAGMLLLLVAAMTCGIVGMLVLARQHLLGVSLGQTAIAVGIHALVCGAAVLLFSSFTSTTLAGTLGLSFVFLGHTVESLSYFAKKSSSIEGEIVLGVVKLLPNLEKLNLKTLAAHQEVIAWGNLGMRVGYGLAYSVAAVGLGAIIFARRDLR